VAVSVRPNRGLEELFDAVEFLAAVRMMFFNDMSHQAGERTSGPICR